ncbi:MAG TPA: cytochrome c [Polyangiaceae bacterium]|nr:cytochrome c [Polyangiaceae bacterium]
MKRSLVLATFLVCWGCRTAPHDAPKPHASAHEAAAEPAQTLHAALDRLDERRPVPLLPMMAQHQKQNMREHLEAVQEVVAAAATGEFDKVAVAGKRLGYSEQMGRMCEHMGAGAPGFTEQALGFHHTADAIVTAAEQRDGAAVLAALAKTLRACTSCHSTYKQQLVANLPEP